MTLLATFQVLLARYSGQTDIVVGTPIANRTRPEIEPLIGCFVNSLALRADLRGNPRFRDLLRQVRETTLGAYEQQDLPFEKLVEELRPERNLSYTPIFQVLFTLEPDAPRPPALPGLTVQLVEVDTGTVKADLQLGLAQTAQGLTGLLGYSTELFDAPTIARLIGYYQRLLAGIVADPTSRIGDLPLLTTVERRQLLVEGNATEAPYPADHCAHELIAAQAARTPDALAVVLGDQQLTYSELDARANRLAHYLRARGVGPEVLVGISVERSLAMVVGVLGILKAGGAYVPLDPAYPAARLAFLLADARPALIVTQQALLARLPPMPAPVVLLDADWPAIAQERADAPVTGVQPTNLAYVIYTSGSTGQPKGVLVAHRGVSNLAALAARLFATGPGDRMLQFCSLNWDTWLLETLTALTTGATLCLCPPGTLPGPDLMRLLRAQGVTHAAIPPAALALLDPTSLPALRALSTGGEICPASGGEPLGGGPPLLQSLRSHRGDRDQRRDALRPGPAAARVGPPARQYRTLCT